ncbi:MAG TPA: methyltransferase domain-containing protein [Acidimicrobiales bacterium]|nr:methyltransferase domain-containing protein [Acidimicrobiales bacterium]
MPDDRRHATSWGGPDQVGRYEAGRPGYPAEVGALIADVLDLRAGRRVVDLAAGTGKLTRVLMGSGAAVVAAEPIAAMRRELSARVVGVPVVAGVAEALPFADGALHAVTVAQAVHWFGWPAAAVELRRVLAPGGGLAVVTNGRDPAWAATDALNAVLERYEAEGPRPESVRAWRDGFDASHVFTAVTDAAVPHEQRFADREAFAARFASVSFAILLPDDLRARMVDDLWEAVAASGVDPLVMPLLARVEIFRCRPAGA